jgi:hypothetical protein
MFPTHRLLVFIGFDYFRNVVNVMLGRIRVFAKWMQFLVLWDLRHKLFQIKLFAIPPLLLLQLRIPFLLSLPIPSRYGFKDSFFLLLLPLNMIFHFSNLWFDEIKFLIQFKVILILILHLILFVEDANTLVSIQFSWPPLTIPLLFPCAYLTIVLVVLWRKIFLVLLLISPCLPLLVLKIATHIYNWISLRSNKISVTIPVHVGRVVLTIGTMLHIVAVILQSDSEVIVISWLHCSGRVGFYRPIVRSPKVLIAKFTAHLNQWIG